MFEKIKSSLVASGWLNPSSASAEEPAKKEGDDTSGKTNTQPVAQNNIPDINPAFAFTTSVGVSVPTEPDEKYVQYVGDELTKLNMQGIDSFELGMATRKLLKNNHITHQMAITNAYDSLSSLDPTVTVEKLVNSCDYYLSKLQELLTDFSAEKDNEFTETKNAIQAEIQKLQTKTQNLATEKQKLLDRLTAINEEEQQIATATKEQETALQTAAHDVDIRKMNMKLAVVKVSGVINEDRAAIVQHLNPSK